MGCHRVVPSHPTSFTCFSEGMELTSSQKERGFQERIIELYNQGDLEAQTLEHLIITGFITTEAAQVQESSGGRILNYIPRNVPLHNNIRAFAVAILRLRDQYEDIRKERTSFRAYIDSHPCDAQLREIHFPQPCLASYIDRTNWPIIWAEFFDSAPGLP
eukprot:5829080-Heterocapsa_arctica.AAC.1